LRTARPTSSSATASRSASASKAGRLTYGALNPPATDGSQNAAAIAIYPRSTDGRRRPDCGDHQRREVIGNGLTWPAGITAAQKAEAILQLRKLASRSANRGTDHEKGRRPFSAAVSRFHRPESHPSIKQERDQQTMLDIFNNNAFGVVSLTDAINKPVFAPGRLGQMGLFNERGVSTTTIVLEQKAGN
jgi:hypothetical protein